MLLKLNMMIISCSSYLLVNKIGTAPCADPEFNSDFLFDSQNGLLKDPISLECVELSKKKPYLRPCN